MIARTDRLVGSEGRDAPQVEQVGVSSAYKPFLSLVVWGSRTLKGADSLANEWKYLAVRRTGAVPRGKPLSRHAVGGVRAER